MNAATIERRLAALSHRILTAQLEFTRLKDELRKGKYPDLATVYTVKETRVKSYTRRGYTAVRVRR